MVNTLMKTEFRKHLQKRGLSEEDTKFAVTAVKDYEVYLEKRKTSLESTDLDVLRDYIQMLNNTNQNSEDRLTALARYYRFARKNDHFVFLVGLFGARNVLPDIGRRLAMIAGERIRNKVFKNFELPVLGAPQEEFAKLTKMIVDGLETELPSETCKEVLTWNYHKVPIESFKEKKERFEKAESIDEFLEEEHQRFVEELIGYMERKEIWYEQEITPEVLEFVKDNQEIQNGVRDGDTIYVCKIPFAPKQFLTEKDPVMKRFYACHCQLVRTSIRDDKPKIPPIFCYCSAGYEKLPYDVIFDEPVQIEVLESVIRGDLRCRFAIKIPKSKIK